MTTNTMASKIVRNTQSNKSKVRVQIKVFQTLDYKMNYLNNEFKRKADLKLPFCLRNTQR